jgi:hypothetical protein
MTTADAPRLSPSQHVLQYFAHEHLPEGPMRDLSSIIGNHARYLETVLPDGPEKTAGLRKLLQAKDCFVRAAIGMAGPLPDRIEGAPS